MFQCLMFCYETVGENIVDMSKFINQKERL